VVEELTQHPMFEGSNVAAPGTMRETMRKLLDFNIKGLEVVAQG
jgi:hypothetical protein